MLHFQFPFGIRWPGQLEVAMAKKNCSLIRAYHYPEFQMSDIMRLAHGRQPVLHTPLVVR